MQRCARSKTTNWYAIAMVLPRAEVLKRISERQRGKLLAAYFDLMRETSSLLKELRDTSSINDTTMVVRRGNDATTWNLAAGAWNKLRQGWFELMYSLQMEEVVEKFCPGKVLRLIAGDVAAWHRSSGGDLHDDTAIWRDLPRPWDVLDGEAICTKQMVEETCRKHGADPKSGWSAPDPSRKVERFTPTPELVHGVVVGSPALAKAFRKAGVFSGKGVTGALSGVDIGAVVDAREAHKTKQEERRKAKKPVMSKSVEKRLRTLGKIV